MSSPDPLRMSADAAPSPASADSPSQGGSAQSGAAAFGRAARLVAFAGLTVCAVALVAGALVGGKAFTGSLWGAGTGAVMTLLAAISLAIPWDRFPLLASSGVMLSFAAKIVVMFAVIFIAGPYKESFSNVWFFGSFAVSLLTVTGVEIVSLAKARTLTVELKRD